MSDHTAEPWIDSDSEDCTHPIIQCEERPGEARLMSREDYARAMLCVHACSAVPDELLETLAATVILSRLCVLEDAARLVLEAYDRFKDVAPALYSEGLPCAVCDAIDGPFRAALERTRL